MRSYTNFFLIIWNCLWAVSMVLVRCMSDGLLEGGDSIQHYQIARYSWSDPELLLHHWGKPLFTLFASPFAQLGHWGMSLFNACCVLATAWAADVFLRRIGGLARWMFVPSLMLVPVQGTMVFAGMTEVFFGLLTMLVVRALYEERYVLAMIVVSFMPFARPEYIAFAPFAVAWVMMKGQWRALPFVVTGHVIYGSIGRVVLGDALWAFTRDPYTWSKEVYGHGSAFHFLGNAFDIYGTPLVVTFLVAPFVGFRLWRRRPEERPVLTLLAVVGLLPVLAIWLVHSVLWWKGLKGSLGLFRVLATAAPLAVLVTLYPLAFAGRPSAISSAKRGWVSLVAAGSYLITAVWAFLNVQPLPVEPWPYDAFIRKVGEHIGDIKGKYGRVVYFHPTLGYYAGLNPYDESTAWPCWGFDTTLADLGLRPNDLVVWDAHFGPNEARTPVEMLLQRPDLKLVELIVPEERMEVLGGHVMEVHLFERSDGVRTEVTIPVLEPGKGFLVEVPHRLDTEACDDGAQDLCFKGTEFPMEITALPFAVDGSLYAVLRISGSFDQQQAAPSSVDLVFSEEGPSGKLSYWSETLVQGPFRFEYRIPPRQPEVSNKIYIWNRSGAAIRMKDLRVEIIRTIAS